MKNHRWNFRKMAVGLALTALIFAYLRISFTGCQYWYKGMKGFLEYWSETVSLANVQWSASPESKEDSSGRRTVSTSATIEATADIINPDGYSLVSDIGDAQSPLKSVRISGDAASTVMSLAKVTSSSPTSISVAVAPVSSVPTSASRALEHTDFSLEFVPTRSETGMEAPEGRILTFRYNTPPRMPLEVVEDGGVLKFPDSTNPWEVVSGSGTALDDIIFWAYPSGITEQTHPDYVVSFRVTDDTDVEEKPASAYRRSRESALQALIPQDIVKAGYEVYCYLAVNGGPVTVEAVDGEGVRGAGITSGQQLHAITLTANSGAFGSGSDSVTVYRAENSSLTGGDLEVPTRDGYELSGWSEAPDGIAVSFPFSVSKPITLYAKWRVGAPASGSGGSSGSTPGTPPSSPPVAPPVVNPHFMYVSPSNGEDSQDGLTASTAFKTIQAAVDKIVANNDGSPYTILLMGDVNDSSSGAYDAGKNSALVNIVPGKALSLTLKSDTPGISRTINAGRTSTNLGRVLYVGNNADVRLENLILTGGNTTDYGGGAYVEGKLTLEADTSIKANEANEGGGVYVKDGGELVMNGGEISGNTAGTNGGGVYVSSDATTIIARRVWGSASTDGTASGGEGDI